MRTTIAALLAAVVMGGCASHTVSRYTARPVPQDRLLAYQVKPTGPSAQIVLVRDAGMSGAACFFAVHVDQVLAARIDTGEIVTLHVPAGAVHLHVAAGDPLSSLCGGGPATSFANRELVLADGDAVTFSILPPGRGTSLLAPYSGD